VQPGATQVVGRSFDGWTAGFPTAHLDGAGSEALVAVGMNGEPLPARHGFPARLIVPGLYGYVSATKWLTEIELTTLEAFDAYWVPLGWAKEAPILTQSRIDVPRAGARRGRVDRVVAGVAWAPTRGIAASRCSSTRARGSRRSCRSAFRCGLGPVARHHRRAGRRAHACASGRPMARARSRSRAAPRPHPTARAAGNPADARDATQEAFVAAWRSLPRLRDADRFDAWFGRITVNSCRMALRRRRGVREIQLDPASADYPAGSRPMAPEGQTTASAFDRAFNRLPVEQRAIIVAHHLDGRGVADVALEMGIPEGTVKSRLHTARTALQRALDDVNR
jgi:RNA polymerase sigma factor (sigma-70 family)